MHLPSTVIIDWHKPRKVTDVFPDAPEGLIPVKTVVPLAEPVLFVIWVEFDSPTVKLWSSIVTLCFPSLNTAVRPVIVSLVGFV